MTMAAKVTDDDLSITGKQSEDSAFDEVTTTFVKNVLRQSYLTIRKELKPDDVLDVFTEEEVFGEDTVVQVRDIKEQNTTTEKNRQIYDTFRSNPDLYVSLKRGLVRSGQTGLLEIIEETEKKIHSQQTGDLHGCSCSDGGSNCRFLDRLKCPTDIPSVTSSLHKGIRQKLIQMYEECKHEITVVFMNLNSLIIPVNNLYVQTIMRRKKTDETDPYIKSLRDVFYIDNKKCHRIVISGNAGYGKSVFCKHIVHLWCSAQSKIAKQSGRGQDLTDNEKVMAEFQLLFYVDLEDTTFSKSDERPDEIANLIYKQLPHKRLKMTYEELTDLLQNDERVLVLMDAFDECQENRLPRGGKYNTCTTIITSRPSQLELSMPDPKFKCDNEIEIIGFDESSATKLIDNLVNALKDDTRRQVLEPRRKTFKEAMIENNLHDFFCTPALLPPMFSLWYDDKPFGQTEGEIYKNIIHHQIVTSITNKNLPKYTCKPETNFKLCEEPDCPCNGYTALVGKVSEFAYDTLLKNVKKDGAMFTPAGKDINENVNDRKMCMKLGIVTQSRPLGRISDQRKTTLGFLHRTYLEWFVAAYLSSKASLEDKDLNNIFSDIFINLDNVLKFGKIFQFVCGQNSIIAAKLSVHIMKTLSLDERMLEFRSTAKDLNDEISELFMITEIQDVIVSGAADAKKTNEATKTLKLNDLILSSFLSKFSPEQILVCDISDAKSFSMIDVENKCTASNFSLPTFACLEKVFIYNVDLTPFQSLIENLFTSKLVIVHLEQVIMTDTQMTNMFCSLSLKKNIIYLNIANPIIRTQTQNTKEVNCKLELASCDAISRLSINIGEQSPNMSIVSWPSSSFISIDLRYLDITHCSNYIDKLSLRMLERLDLHNVTMTHDHVKHLFLNLKFAEKLNVFQIAQLTCATHRNYRQDCLLQLDLTKHYKLKVIILWNLRFNFTEVNVCQIMNLLERLELSSVTIKHEQIKCLFLSLGTANNITDLKMKELICSTHENNRQDCNLQLDISMHTGLKNLLLWDLRISLLEVYFGQNKLNFRYLDLGNLTMTHEQVEYLFKMLNVIEELEHLTIEELSCSSHNDDRHKCSLQLDLSKHCNMVRLFLLNFHVGENLNDGANTGHNSSKVVYDWQFGNWIDLSDNPDSSGFWFCNLRVGIREVIFCQNMAKLQLIKLKNVTMTHEQAECLFQSLDTADNLICIDIEKLTCSTHNNNKQECNHQLDLSKHSGLEFIKLEDLQVGLIEVYLCHNMTNVEHFQLRNVSMTHVQAECLIQSLQSVGNLSNLHMIHLTCSTHKDNDQDCNLELDLSKHFGLEVIWLGDLQVGLREVTFCQNMTNLKNLSLCKLTMTHEQAECLFQSLDSVDNLICIQIEELTCSTHKGNKIDCRLHVDLSKHCELAAIVLWDLSVGLIEFTVCQNLNKLTDLLLSSVQMTHKQVECLFKSLNSVDSLSRILMRELTCSTHNGNKQDCNLKLDLSKYPKPKDIRLWDLHVGLRDVKFHQSMTKLTTLNISNLTITHEQVECLFQSLSSVDGLSHMRMRELTCSTHKDNGQDCNLKLNLSKHPGLKAIWLWDLHVGLRDVKFHQSMTKLTILNISNLTITHEQVECLFQSLSSVDGLSDMKMRELTCSTHKDNDQGCNLKLDLSKHPGLEAFLLRDLHVGLRDVKFHQSMTKLTILHVSNLTMTHEQAECLFQSLSSVDGLSHMKMRELTCSTHKDNGQDCNLKLNLSKHSGLTVIELWDLTVGLREVKFCQNMPKLTILHLSNLTVTHEQAEFLFQSLDSVDNLIKINIRELTCSTHRDNDQGCNLKLDLSKHPGLEAIWLWDLHVGLRDVKFHQSMTKLTTLHVSNLTMTHEQAECLFQSLSSVDGLYHMRMRELTCSTHKDNGQDCNLKLNLSKHSGLTVIELWDLTVGLREVKFCQNMPKLTILHLSNLTVTHEQAEFLFQSLDSVDNLIKINIRELTCSTHRDNDQGCNLKLDLSKHPGLEAIWLWDLHVGLRDVKFHQSMTKLTTLHVSNLTMTHEQAECLFQSLSSVDGLYHMRMRELTCSTHKDNDQGCNLKLDLSKHPGLEDIRLWDLDVGLKEVKFHQHMTKLENLHISNLTMTHEQAECLFQSLSSVDGLSHMKMRELTCSTHKDNGQDCNLKLNLSKHSGLTVIELWDLTVGLREVKFCQNMPKLTILHLSNLTVTHEQAEFLFQSLDSVDNLIKINIRELTCSTHRDNDQGCNLKLDLSKHPGLEAIWLWDLHVGLRDVKFHQSMTKLTILNISNLTITHEQVECLFQSLSSVDGLSDMKMRELTCSTHKDNDQGCNLKLDLSKHPGLEDIRLWDLDVGLKEVKFHQHMTKLENLHISNLTMTHEQAECLFQSLSSVDGLSHMKMRELTCSTHKDNGQDCNLKLNLSKHSGLTVIELWDLTVGLREVKFCQNMPKLTILHLSNLTVTHEQAEFLFQSLDSVDNLIKINIRELTCSTHRDNDQGCNLKLDLSKHPGLEAIWLWDLHVGLRDVKFHQSMTKLTTLHVSNLTMTHEQAECLFQSLSSVDGLSHMRMRELTCSTHKDNGQDCNLKLNLSKHSGLTVIELWDLTVGLREVKFCQNMPKLTILHLSNLTVTHEQAEFLFQSLDSVDNLIKINIRELTCSTHRDNDQGCNLKLDLSKHPGLEAIWLWDLHVGLRDVKFHQSMTKLTILNISNLTITHEQVECLFQSLSSVDGLSDMKMRELTCSTHKDNDQGCNLKLDLSKHSGLEAFLLRDLHVGLRDVKFHQSMTKLTTLHVSNLTMTHEQAECLFQSLSSVDDLSHMKMRELTCSTHKDNGQDCNLKLNLSKHSGLTVIELWDLTVGLREVKFCQNMPKLTILHLSNLTVTHEQAEFLFQSLDSVDNLIKINIRELTCSTHRDNDQGCNLKLDLSKHPGLEAIWLWDLHVGLRDVKFHQSMTKLTILNISNLTITHEQVECLFQSLSSVDGLSDMKMRELTCSTHKDNDQDCNLTLDLSKHPGLEAIWLCDLHVGLRDVKFHQSMAKLTILIISNLTITHEQAECLFQNLNSLDRLSDMKMRELTCSTHKDNGQDCNLKLDLSKHPGLEDIRLWDLDVGLKEVKFHQHMTKLENLHLSNLTMTHEQAECLFQSLNSVDCLSDIIIRELTCSTHKDNNQDCNLKLDLSKHPGLEDIRLWDLDVGLKEVKFHQHMTKLENLHISNLTMTHEQAECLFQSLNSVDCLSDIIIRELTCSTHKDNVQDCNLKLDLSKHPELEFIWILDFGLREIKFCQNMPKLTTLHVSNLTMTHEQVECIFQSLNSVDCLSDIRMWELTCCTNKDNDQYCNLKLDLSKHYRLKVIELWDLNVGLREVKFHQSMTELTILNISNLKITHEQAECLFQNLNSADCLSDLQMSELTCCTHKDNNQDCNIKLDLSKHPGLEDIRLWDLDVGLKEVKFHQHMTKLENLHLSNLTMTHEQVECLFQSLNSVDCLSDIRMRELTCSTHKENFQDCHLKLDLSKHPELEFIWLLDLHVGLREVTFCQTMTKLKDIFITNLTMTHEQAECLFKILDSVDNLIEIKLKELTCSTHKNKDQNCNLKLDLYQSIID